MRFPETASDLRIPALPFGKRIKIAGQIYNPVSHLDSVGFQHHLLNAFPAENIPAGKFAEAIYHAITRRSGRIAIGMKRIADRAGHMRSPECAGDLSVSRHATVRDLPDKPINGFEKSIHKSSPEKKFKK